MKKAGLQNTDVTSRFHSTTSGQNVQWPGYAKLAVSQHALESINDALGCLLRIRLQRLSDFQLIRSLNNGATQFGWKTRFGTATGMGEWGPSALIEADGHRVLLDTGAHPDTVLQNARDLKIDTPTLMK